MYRLQQKKLISCFLENDYFIQNNISPKYYPVNYSQEPLNFSNCKDDLIHSLLRNKSIDWVYEEEERIVWYSGNEKIKKFFIYPVYDNLIEEIFFGPLSPSHHIDEIMNYAKGLNINFFRTKKRNLVST